MTARVSLGSGLIGDLEPFEETREYRSWISPFAVPQWAEVDWAGPGLVRGIRFHYLGGEPVEGGGVREPLDQRTDPNVDLVFTDPMGKVQAVQCRPSADAGALERIGDRLAARAQQEKLLGRRFSVLMIGRVLKYWASGMQLWTCGGIELKTGIRQEGQCRVVVVDLQTQRRVLDRTYRGPMENPQSLLEGQVEVTWAEGGGMRIIGAEKGSAAMQRWRWSQPRTAWEEGGCPPDKVLQALFTAMGWRGEAPVCA
jgi:hypothetical protein